MERKIERKVFKMLRWSKIKAAAMLSAGIVACFCSCGKETEHKEESNTKVKLYVLLQTEDYQNQNVWKGENAERLYDETGITLSLTSMNAAGNKQIEQYMVTGMLPDVMIFRGVNQAKVLMDAGLLMKWNQYDIHLENVFKEEAYQNAISDSIQFMGDEEGNLLLLPIPVCKQNHSKAEQLPFLRFLPYSIIESPKVETLEDYLDIVETMENRTPYTVKGYETYGFSLSGERDVYALEQASALGYLYGLDLCMVSPLMETDPGAGTTVSIFREGSFYKRALHFYYEANQRGLLDPNSRNQTQKSLQEKYESGSVMFGIQEEMTNLYWSDISGRFSGEYKGDAYIPVLAEDMTIYRSEDSELRSNWYIAVNALSSNKEKACEFLNWLYDREEGNQFFCGEAGIIGSEKTDGVEDRSWEKILNVEEFEKELDEKSVYVGNEVNRISPVEASLSEKMKDIGKVNCRLSWDMIYAESEEEFEALWVKLCTEVKKLGMDEVEAFYQKAYAEARKE